MAEYKSGPMPGTDLRYEDFEAFLAGYALTFACLETSTRFSDPQDYAAIMRILNDFADRYQVQPPLRALAQPRRKHAIIKPQEFSNEEMIQMTGSFAKDFAIGRVYVGGVRDVDATEVLRLRQIIFGLVDIYVLAEVIYVNDKNGRTPVKVKRWTPEESRFKYLWESVRNWVGRV